mmetsp:Transcript_26938/g.38222  ORF Transcript_26938/g.38222 Transcript_26938/m.38222 type:complete len:88 (+) Transcript_26938:27-290(+)
MIWIMSLANSFCFQRSSKFKRRRSEPKRDIIAQGEVNGGSCQVKYNIKEVICFRYPLGGNFNQLKDQVGGRDVLMPILFHPVLASHV